MKRIPIILLCIIFSYASLCEAQSESDIIPKLNSESIFKDLQSAYEAMLNNAAIPSKLDNKPCKIEQALNVLKMSDVPFRLIGFSFAEFTYLLNYDIQGNTVEIFDKGNFKSLEDKALNAYSTTSSFEKFVLALTGKAIGDIDSFYIDKDDQQKHTDLQLLRKYYDDCNHFFTKGRLIDFIAPIDKDGCVVKSKSYIKVNSFFYPNISFSLKTEVGVDCNCAETSKTSDLKYAYLMFEADLKGIYTKSKITLNNSTNARLTDARLECCSKKQETTETALKDDEGIKDLMPDQTIGFGAGIGFAQDFEETTFCFTAEYLYQLNSDDYKGWYLGAEGTYQNTSFGDFSSSVIKGGPKIQHNFSGTPSGETQFVAGIMANYAFGNNDYNGNKDEFTGIIGCLYGGINVRICDDWSIGGQFPVFIYENFTFKPENGEEFEVDGTSLFINKDNPLKIVVRYSF